MKNQTKNQMKNRNFTKSETRLLNERIELDLFNEVSECIKLFKKLQDNPKSCKNEFVKTGFPLINKTQIELLEQEELTNIYIEQVDKSLWLVHWIKPKIEKVSKGKRNKQIIVL